MSEVKRYKWLGDLIYADGKYAYPDNPESLVDSAVYDALVIEHRDMAIVQAKAEAALIIERDALKLDAARYRFLRRRILVRKADAPACDVTVHLNRDYIHAGSQFISAKGFEAEMKVLDATIDTAMEYPR